MPAALGGEGETTGDVWMTDQSTEFEAIRERSLAWQQSYECNDPTKQAQIDRATLLRKVDELTRAAKET
jgi:hypothetical protein